MLVTLKLAGGLSSEEGQIKVTDLSKGPLCVGRSPDADWTLIDPTNRVSGMHFELRRQGESVVVIDTSSGGTSLDQPGARLQKGQPAKLNDTARLILPVGEVRVSIDRHAPTHAVEDEAEKTDFFLVRKMQGERRAGAEPFGATPPSSAAPSRPKREAPSLGGDSAAASQSGIGAGLTGPRQFKSAPKPARERRRENPQAGSAKGPSSFDDLLSGDAGPFSDPVPGEPEPPEFDAPPDPEETREPEQGGGLPESLTPDAPGPQIRETQAPELEAPESLPDESPQQPAAAAVPPASGREAPAPAAPATAGTPSDEEAMRALFEAVGLDYDDIPPEERVETAALMGRLVVAMADTLRRLLDGRRMVKRELGIAGTQVEFGANPLKFAPTTEAAVEGLIRPLASGYITGEDAVSDALGSMQSHQLALVGAIRSAVKVALDAFNPTELERKLETRGLSHVVPALRRAELWDRFREHYARFAEQTDDDIRAVIGRELDRLYAASQDQVAGRTRPGTHEDER